jgi:hypothetical protein
MSSIQEWCNDWRSQASLHKEASRPEIHFEDSHYHHAYIIHIGSATIVVPYQCMQIPGTFVVGENRSYAPGERIDSMRPPSPNYFYDRQRPAKKEEPKPKETTDLCSTHIYTRK